MVFMAVWKLLHVCYLISSCPYGAFGCIIIMAVQHGQCTLSAADAADAAVAAVAAALLRSCVAAVGIASTADTDVVNK